LGSRVFLRRPSARDRAELLALVRGSRRLHGAWVYPPRDRREFSVYLRRARSPQQARLLVCLRDGGAIVGVVNLNEIVRGALQSAYLGFYGAARYAGRGYMTEGVRLALRYAFQVLGLHRVEANIQPGNRPSIALVQRCGFHREGFSARYLKVGGRWRDHERWALLAEGRGRHPRPRRAGGSRD
jgi:ribosomal-protein-alanine N-acetyltransferase